MRQLPGTNLLEGTEVCCRRGQCPHSCGATIGGSDVLGPLRDGCSNGLPAGAFAVPGGPTYFGSGTEDVRDGRSVQGDHLEGEAGSLWNGNFSSILGGLYRNRTMAQMRGTVSEGEVRFVASEIDGSLWYVLVGGRRAGVIICYVDDLLIAGESKVAKEASLMIARTWKCTEPQWATAKEGVTFNGFEIQRTDQGLLLGQNAYTKDLLARYNLEGFEETPAPVQLATVDFELKPEENAADHVRAAQCSGWGAAMVSESMPS